MKRIFYHKGINRANALSVFLVAMLTIFILVFIIYNLHNDNKIEIENIEKEYIQNQKELIKQETNRALNYIAYKHQNSHNKPLKELQSEIVDAIEQMRNERDGSGYIFIYTFDGVNIADPILKENAGKNLLHVKDSNGKEVISELIKVSKKDGGGFVEYVWNKPLVNTSSPKISYATSYSPWQWMVGSGVYLDDVYAAIKKRKMAYNNRVSKYIVGILSLSTILFLIGMAIYRYFASTITKDIGYIQNNLKIISSTYKKLDLDEIRYDEFIKIAKDINSMVEEIRDQKVALEELNRNLEFRVEVKTKKLQNAKEFAEVLVEKQDKFIKNATHEINTPLSIIMTNIDLYNMNNPTNRYLSKIEAAVKIIHNIYNDLSFLAKKDHVEYKKSILDFSKLIQERVDFFYEVAFGNRIILYFDIEPNIKIEFNEVELQRICDNNISNAIKYGFEDSMVKVNLFSKHKKIVLEVVSMGDEIHNPNHLFERFYRENSSRGGFGIGLHIVKEICDKNGVDIEISSQNGQNSFRYFFKDLSENTTS